MAGEKRILGLVIDKNSASKLKKVCGYLPERGGKGGYYKQTCLILINKKTINLNTSRSFILNLMA
jgi:hypothetical protein